MQKHVLSLQREANQIYKNPATKVFFILKERDNTALKLATQTQAYFYRISSSTLKWETAVCFFVLQAMRESPRKTQKAELDQQLKGSLAQVASEYARSCNELERWSHKDIVEPKGGELKWEKNKLTQNEPDKKYQRSCG